MVSGPTLLLHSLLLMLLHPPSLEVVLVLGESYPSYVEKRRKNGENDAKNAMWAPMARGVTERAHRTM